MVGNGTGAALFNGLAGGTNTFNNGVRIAAQGTLTANGTVTSGFMETLANGTVNLNGTLSGTTTLLTNNGTFNASNSFTVAGLEGTTGILNLNGAGVTGTLNTAGTSTYDGVIAGAGAWTKQGTGTFNLGGNNTFTGPLNINGGILNANGGNAIADTVAVTVNTGATLGLGSSETIGSLAGAGNVTLGGNTLSAGGNNTSTTFSGVMSGTGAYTKNGTGTNTLTGVNTYTGTTTVNAGALVLNGSVVGDLIVNASGFLGGSGTIGGNLFNNGFINPGNSPGILNITGNFIQGAGGTLLMEVNGITPGQFDQLNITGTANLNGTLQLITTGVVTLEGGDSIPIILAAGGINGQFANVLGTAALGADLIYTANQVTVAISAVSYTNNPVLNPNQRAIAAVLQQVRYNNNPDWVNNVRPVLNGLNQQQIAAAFDQMSPVFYQSMPQAQMGWMQNQFQNVRGRFDELHFGNQNGISTRNLALFDARGERLLAGSGSMVATDLGSPLYAPKQSQWDKKLGMFISGSGQFGNMGAASALNGYDFQTAGLTLGMDYQINENLVVGVFGGYASTWTEQDANSGKSDANTGQGGIYATYFRKNTFLNVVAGGGYTSYDTERPIVIGSLNRTATANPNGAQAFTMIEAGHDFVVGKLRLGPVAGFQYRKANVNEFTEQGAGALNLTVKERDLQSIMSQAGVRLSYEFKLGKVLIVPSASARWQHEFANTDEAMLARFGTLNSGTFSVSTVGPGEDSALINVGLNTYLTETINIFAAYNLETDTADYTVNGVNAGFSWKF